MPAGWIESLDLSRAVQNLHTELRGDWYRDPWGWPEFEWLAGSGRDLVARRLLATDGWAVAKIDVPKENFSRRPAVVINPVDRVCYQALVDRLSKNVIGDLAPSTYGWRLPSKNASSGHYATNGNQWRDYRHHLTDLAYENAALKTDIVSFFASIPITDLIDVLHATAPGGAVQNRLITYLEGWDRVDERSGLPQRSWASSILANMYLQSLDEVLDANAQTVTLWPEDRERRSWLRWMDDIWVFGPDAGLLRRAQIQVENALRSLGLHMNTGKTRLLEGDDVAVEALRVEHSAVDGALNGDSPDLQPLAEMIEEILRQKECASRTSIRFATGRMRKHGYYSRVDDIVEEAHRLPHGADAVARLLRDAGRAASVLDWYLEYVDGSWASFEWSIAQYGTIFPSEDRPDSRLIDLLERLLNSLPTLPLFALCCQRLAVWKPDAIKAAVRELTRHTANPLHRRVLALSALAAGETRPRVRSMLNEHPENEATLAMLEATGFAPPRLQADFSGET